MPRSGRHLDLGCGLNPRNPYGFDDLHGIDLVMPSQPPAAFQLRVANLTMAPIPYPADHFDAVSAFDFLEHVPRVLATPDGEGTRFPFLDLMGEIWRVLKPGGQFYALTPAYPSAEAFQDPTHVNIITAETHTYFCGAAPYATHYGFRGRFACQRAGWTYAKYAETAEWNGRKRWRSALRRLSSAPPTHFLWELSAVKPIA